MTLSEHTKIRPSGLASHNALPNLDHYLGAPLFQAPSTPTVSFNESSTAYTINLHAPGMEHEAFNVALKDNVLQVQCTAFSKSFIVPNNVDRQAITAIYINGTLTLCLGKVLLKQA